MGNTFKAGDIVEIKSGNDLVQGKGIVLSNSYDKNYNRIEGSYVVFLYHEAAKPQSNYQEVQASDLALLII